MVQQWATLNPSTHVPTPQNHPFFLTSLQEDLIAT
jgi:hypothetical protein